MANPARDREYVTLSYHPQTPVTPEALHELTRLIEGYLQRMEGRIELLQDTVVRLDFDVAELQKRMAAL